MTPAFVRLASFAAAASLIATAAAAAPQPPCRDDSRACLEKIGRLYIAALTSHDGSKLPLAPDIRRTENALTNARGAAEVRESFARTTMVQGAREIRAYVDDRTGEAIFYFVIDVALAKSDVSAGGTTRAGDTEYKTAVSVPPGSYTVHEAERFRIAKGMITEIEIVAHVEDGKGQGSGWPVPRSATVGPK